MFWLVVGAMGLGCREEAPVEEAPWGALERDVSPGTLVIPDPWPDEVGLPTPIVADLDGDGWVDLVGGQAGACLSSEYTCERHPALAVWVNSVLAVWRGGAAGFPAVPTFQATTPDPIRYAHPSAVVGDTDGDGVTEVLVADPSWDGDRGKVWLAAASPALRPPQWTLEGSGSGMLLGGAVEPLGDVNGDGYDDLMLGWWEEGVVGVFYGGPGGFGAAPDWTSGPLAYSAGTGLAVGDIDGDGYPDAFVGAPQAFYDPSGSFNEAFVFGFRGGPGGFGPTPDWALSRAQVDYDFAGFFGSQLLVVPDLNGDGYRELVVAAPGANEVAVFEGGSAGPATTPTWTYTGSGRALAAGDVDGDGRTDLLMTGGGGTQVVLGVAGGLSPTVAYVLQGPDDASCFSGVSGADVDTFEHSIQVADVDRDGRDDVVFACSSYTAFLGGDGIWVAYGGVDTDGDAAPDAVDCAPTDPAIYPGATEIWYDAIDQDCDGGDDFDQDGDGVQALPWGLDVDDTDPDVTLSLVVSGSCAVSLDLAVDAADPGATVEFYAGRYDDGGHWWPANPNPCYGDAALDLLPTPTLLASAVADASGHAVLTGVAPWPTACTDRVQALELSTCTKSTAHTTPP